MMHGQKTIKLCNVIIYFNILTNFKRSELLNITIQYVRKTFVKLRMAQTRPKHVVVLNNTEMLVFRLI
jgi:hypothetical protein